MFVEKNKVDLASLIEAGVHGLVGDVPCDGGREHVVAEHVKQAAHNQRVVDDCEFVVGVRVGVDDLYSEGEDKVPWLLVELDQRIGSFIVDRYKIGEDVLLLRLVTANLHYQILETLAVRRNAVAAVEVLPVLQRHLDLLQLVDCLEWVRGAADWEVYVNLVCMVFRA